MEEGYPFDGTGRLFRFAQGLVSIGIQNNTVIVYDNDAEGVAKYKSTKRLNLPLNMRAICLPEMKDFTVFPTCGPGGLFFTDINGCAASTECYLDLGYKSLSSPFVRWSAYNRSEDCYQGELEKKTAFMKTFLDLRRKTDAYDFSKISAVLDAIVDECVGIAEATMCE